VTALLIGVQTAFSDTQYFQENTSKLMVALD
jgi:hypothetical protein